VITQVGQSGVEIIANEWCCRQMCWNCWRIPGLCLR